jgi:hypothetical protein
MNKNSVKYLQAINFSRLPITGKNEIKNLGRVKPDLAIFQLS